MNDEVNSRNWWEKNQQVGALLGGFVLADTPVQQSLLEYLHLNVSPHLWYHGPAEPNISQTLWIFFESQDIHKVVPHSQQSCLNQLLGKHYELWVSELELHG
jgi:hypothetical protein